ncbi:MAG: tRNA1(Val) (adenine(37)-N6)-methyltransferase [Ruminococcaceae bacterium]|nr:tRNA1(Val) (adenine(37)-N6)-methyltransferase [Oscillospiraceae bacterium]
MLSLEKMNEFERKDDLQLGGLHIWQDRREFCFGVDAVLLSAFAEIKKGERVLDMCSGNGIIPILLAGKTEAEAIYGLEINPVQVRLAKRSIAENNLSHVEMIEGDVKEANTLFTGKRFDAVTCNPPYIRDGRIQNPNRNKAIARHEILCTLSDVLKSAAKVLRYGGRLYMVHRPDRLTEIMREMHNCRLEPKRLRSVHAKKESRASLVLIEAVLGGGTFLHVMPPLILYQEDGTYTKDALASYGRDIECVEHSTFVQHP